MAKIVSLPAEGDRIKVSDSPEYYVGIVSESFRPLFVQNQSCVTARDRMVWTRTPTGYYSYVIFRTIGHFSGDFSSVHWTVTSHSKFQNPQFWLLCQNPQLAHLPGPSTPQFQYPHFRRLFQNPQLTVYLSINHFDCLRNRDKRHPLKSSETYFTYYSPHLATACASDSVCLLTLRALQMFVLLCLPKFVMRLPAEQN